MLKIQAKLVWSQVVLSSALVWGTAACDKGKDDNNNGDPTDTTTSPTSATESVETTATETATTSDTETQAHNECGVPCDLFNEACPDNEQCAPYLCDPQALGWDVDRCVPIGPRTVGQACADPWTNKPDEYCADGLMCWGGFCKEQCTGTMQDPLCAQGDEVCLLGGSGVLAVCMERCDPFNSACEPAETCVPAGEQGHATDFGCLGNGFFPVLGVRGDPCEYLISCADGLYCTLQYGPGTVDAPGCEDKACCTPFCKLDGGDDQCPGATERCVPVLEEPDPGAENFGWCVIPRED